MTRVDAYEQFDRFADNAKTTFDALLNADSRAQRLATRYSFHAVKGGALGGMNKRLVEVFFGTRPFDQVTVLDTDSGGFSAPRRTFVTEQGACLRYERTDSGSVICTLFPATTENLKQVEDFLLYKVIANPTRLNASTVVEKHWKAFISYMECTNIDSAPNLVDRLRIRWLRFTKPLGKNSALQPPRLQAASQKIGGYVLTVGLSGFLLALVNYYMGSKDIDALRVDQKAQIIEVAKAQSVVQAQAARIESLEVALKELHLKPLPPVTCACTVAPTPGPVQK